MWFTCYHMLTSNYSNWYYKQYIFYWSSQDLAICGNNQLSYISFGPFRPYLNTSYTQKNRWFCLSKFTIFKILKTNKWISDIQIPFWSVNSFFTIRKYPKSKINQPMTLTIKRAIKNIKKTNILWLYFKYSFKETWCRWSFILCVAFIG